MRAACRNRTDDLRITRRRHHAQPGRIGFQITLSASTGVHSRPAAWLQNWLQLTDGGPAKVVTVVGQPPEGRCRGAGHDRPAHQTRGRRSTRPSTSPRDARRGRASAGGAVLDGPRVDPRRRHRRLRPAVRLHKKSVDTVDAPSLSWSLSVRSKSVRRPSPLRQQHRHPPPAPSGRARHAAAPGSRRRPAHRTRRETGDPDRGTAATAHWRHRHEDLLADCGVTSSERGTASSPRCMLIMAR